ncbi:hypothetical protein ARZXY2_2171 [Arthrobacter sp. ZXY-2]|nr:hypothetical protein ARZXY2_2171 [Arthrobacter sp. ZXY-2]
MPGIQSGELRGQDWRFPGKFLNAQNQGNISSGYACFGAMVIVHTSLVPSRP